MNDIDEAGETEFYIKTKDLCLRKIDCRFAIGQKDKYILRIPRVLKRILMTYVVNDKCLMLYSDCLSVD